MSLLASMGTVVLTGVLAHGLAGPDAGAAAVSLAASAVGRLRSLFPSNPRLDLYLNILGNLRGTTNPISLPLGVEPETGLDRGSVVFAAAPLGISKTSEGPEWLIRFDHSQSEAHRLSARYIYDSRLNSPNSVQFPGFILDNGARNHDFQFTDSYTFGPTYTNEFRFS
jgi:hypothetical protein